MFENVQDSINNLLEEINEINDRLRLRPTLLDVDLINQKIIQLYDLTNILRRDLKNAKVKPGIQTSDFLKEKIEAEKKQKVEKKPEIETGKVSTERKSVPKNKEKEVEVRETKEIRSKETTPEPEVEIRKAPAKKKTEKIVIPEFEIEEEKVETTNAGPDAEMVIENEEVTDEKEDEIEKEKEELPSLFNENYYAKKTDLDLYNEDQAVDKKPVHEKFAKEDKSINKKLTSSEKRKVSDKLQKGPIADIKSAINLNLKLSFIKDLYQGDQKEYKKMIDFLGRCKNYSEARFYITREQESRPYWVDKAELVDTLMDLIERRFRSDD